MTRSRSREVCLPEGYGAFSVSASQAPKAIAYINSQKEHHRKRTFQEEFLELLQKHGIDYDQRYVFYATVRFTDYLSKNWKDFHR